MKYAVCLVLGVCLVGCGGSSGGGKAAPPRVQFELESFQVTEDAGTATIAVIRGGSSKGAVSVDYATSDGTAVAPEEPAAAGTEGLFGGLRDALR